MKILTVIPMMGIGGAEAVAADLVLDAQGRGDSVRLASGGGFRAEAMVRAGVPHLLLPLDLRQPRRPGDLARSVRLLRTACREDRPDIVHAHNVKAAAIARLALCSRTPVITTVHGMPEHEVGLAARLLRWTSDRVVAVSPHVSAQLGVHGFPASRIDLIENGIAPLPTHPRDEARRRLGLNEDTAVVLCLARMAEPKRHDLLVQAWSEVAGDAVLLLVGDGPNRSRIEETVAQSSVADRVRILGARTDVDWLLAAADIVVLPTDREGLPISLLEAMAAGVPVVASRVGGIAETLGEAVRLVEPGSVPALTRALDDLIGDPVRRADLGNRGRALVVTTYGAEPMLKAYRELFDEITGSVRSRS